MMTRLIFCLTNGLALLSLGHCLSVGRNVDDIGRASCSFDLDQREGDINPMIIDQDNHIIYPSDSRVMTFGNSFIIQYNYVPFVSRRLIYIIGGVPE